MGQIFTIDDDRTVYCKARMMAHNGAWNAVRKVWMFGSAGDAANALCELYKATRASIAMRETLHQMVLDGTAAVAWDFDPLTQTIDLDALDYPEASRLLVAGYVARRVLGVHPLEDLDADRSTDDGLRDVAFDERARASAARSRGHRRTAM